MSRGAKVRERLPLAQPDGNGSTGRRDDGISDFRVEILGGNFRRVLAQLWTEAS